MKYYENNNFKINLDREYISSAMSNDFDCDNEVLDILKLYNEFNNNCVLNDQRFRFKRIRIKGIITYIGLDIHNVPSFELSNEKNGYTLSLCCLKSDKEYKNKKVGDEIIVEGNYLITNEKYGIVLKRSELID